jgi:sugar/nucleoside kinase (ribokinase family)
MSPDLVVLGNLIVDDIVYPDGSTRMAQPGGAILYMGLAARLWRVDVGLVSIAGSDFPEAALSQLEERGAELAGVRRSPEPGLRTWLLYEGGLRQVVHRLAGATHLEASPTAADVPVDWQPRVLHLAPMPGSLHRQQITDLRSRFPDVLISLDPFELLSGDDQAPYTEYLDGVDLFFVSEDELGNRAMRRNPEPWLHQLLGQRLRTIFLKQGERGGTVLRSDRSSSHPWPGRAGEGVDTTGAGDAFAAGVLAALLHEQSLERAVQWGAVSASFAIQGQGPQALLAATPDDARRRLASWFGA